MNFIAAIIFSVIAAILALAIIASTTAVPAGLVYALAFFAWIAGVYTVVA